MNNELIHSDEGMVTVFWNEPHPENADQVTEASASNNGMFFIYADGTVKIDTENKLIVYPGASLTRVEADSPTSAYAGSPYGDDDPLTEL